MTWHQVTTGEQGSHRGVLARGRLLTDCRTVFPASQAVRLDSDAPDPGQLCPGCQRAGDTPR